MGNRNQYGRFRQLWATVGNCLIRINTDDEFCFNCPIRTVQLGANATHGLKRTNADKRRSVELALAEWPKMSDVELSKICAVGNKFVGDVRRDMEDNLVLDKVATRIGADGKERKLPTRKQPEPSMSGARSDTFQRFNPNL